MGYNEELPHISEKSVRSRRRVTNAADKVDKRYLGLGFLIYTLIVFTLWWFGITSWLDRSAKLYLSPNSLLRPHCANIAPISTDEFLARQAKLAETLKELGASSFIAEPGATAKYYFNVSSSDWHLSERPLLFVLTPGDRDLEGYKVSVLTPTFEATRAKLLPVPYEGALQYVSWNEEADPYRPVFESIVNGQDTIYVDGAMRKFIADGLQKAMNGASLETAPREIAVLRERKSEAELELMKCANEATVLAIRHVHKKLYVNMHESEASDMMTKALSDIGLKQGECLTLFGENAALPHGSGTDRRLRKHEFALFDCTASLHGYWSDVTRTVSVPGQLVPAESMQIWRTVRMAQSVALQAAVDGAIAKDVDKAARDFIGMMGKEGYFTHRLGHGIGLEVHESPYLNGGSEAVVQQGHTFSDEPGVYIEGKIGVRLEDCFYISEEGKAVPLTQGVGGMAYNPWEP